MEPSRRLPFLRAVREIACNEVKRLARDRRALFSAVLLPALIYPLFFHGQAWLKAFSTSSLAERSVTIALDLELAPEPVRQRLPRQLVSGSTVDLVEAGLRPEMASSLQQLRELTLALHEGRPEALDRERELVSRLFESDVDVLVTCQPPPTLSSRRVMQVYHDGADELSNEGLARVERAIVALEDHVRGERIETLLGADDPARGLDLVAVDLASERDTSGAALGSLLPLLALLVIISGGSFAALSVFAGEREAGTLETLLVQPLPAAAVAWGKFYAVLAVSLAALACNVGSLLISLSLGLGALPGLEPGEGQGLVLAVGGGRLLLAGRVFLPPGVLTAALLALISAGARTFREGQHLLLPLTLVAALPAAVAGWTETPLDPLTALAPLLGACLAVREAMRGGLELAPACILLVASTGWAVLAVRALARVLSTERILQGGRIGEESIQNRMQSRTAIGYGLVAVLGSYVVGGWLQSRFGVKGLLLTLWGLLPLLAWLCGPPSGWGPPRCARSPARCCVRPSWRRACGRWSRRRRASRRCPPGCSRPPAPGGCSARWSSSGRSGSSSCSRCRRGSARSCCSAGRCCRDCAATSEPAASCSGRRCCSAPPTPPSTASCPPRWSVRCWPR